MGRYVNSNLLPQERVIHETGYHWINWISWLSLFTLALYPTIQALTDEFVVTSQRIIIKRGLIAINSFEMNLSRVETVNVYQSILGRLFGYGSIAIIGTGGTRAVIHNVRRPLMFRYRFMAII